MKKGDISNLLRRLNLIYLTDWMRYYVQYFKNYRSNQAFKHAHPEVKLPPDYLIYESFQIDYKKYDVSKDKSYKTVCTKSWKINYLRLELSTLGSLFLSSAVILQLRLIQQSNLKFSFDFCVHIYNTK